VGTIATLTIKLSPGLAVLYGLVIVVWYELLRSLIQRRRARTALNPASHLHKSARAEPGEHEGSPDGRRAAMESELERARRHYHLAREEARSERDAAIAAAHQAAEQAIERIEGRYREIDGEFIDEETERILEMLRGPAGDEAP